MYENVAQGLCVYENVVQGLCAYENMTQGLCAYENVCIKLLAIFLPMFPVIEVSAGPPSLAREMDGLCSLPFLRT